MKDFEGFGLYDKDFLPDPLAAQYIPCLYVKDISGLPLNDSYTPPKRFHAEDW